MLPPLVLFARREGEVRWNQISAEMSVGHKGEPEFRRVCFRMADSFVVSRRFPRGFT